MHGPGERHILVVDDDPVNLSLLGRILTGAGFANAGAPNGEMALDLAYGDPPDLILLDVNMTGIDGFETCRRLKAEPTTADIPVIFMTGLSDMEDRLAGFQAGAVDYVTKPFEIEEIVARVSTQMHLRRIARELAESNERLADENKERAAVEAELIRLNRELEQRVEDRTGDLARALRELSEAKTALASANEDLQRSNTALKREAERREGELRTVRTQLEAELAQRAREEEQRTALTTEIIAVQRQSLEEMSTPLIPITDTIMVMPMIGTMTEERADQLLDTALRGVQTHNADVVIIDVTGMKILDSSVATSLLETASALRLLGAQAVITGIRPDLAQTLTTMGVDLGDIVTRGTLKSGIAYALRRAGSAGRRVTLSDPEANSRGPRSRAVDEPDR